MKKNKSYRESKIDLAQIIADFTGRQDVSYIRAMLVSKYPDIFNREFCPNCGASMEEYIFYFDILDAALLYAMAKEFRKRRQSGLDFTVSNQIHIPSLACSHAIKCRTTQSSKLGLVAKVKNANGRHAKGMWCITDRGFSALRGEKVPAQVKVWRGEIQERFDNTISIGEAILVHKHNVEDHIRRNKNTKRDYRSEFSDYQATDWFDTETHNGDLFKTNG